MRPTLMDGMKVKSVKKKLKDKAFARNVNREELNVALEALEIDPAVFIEWMIKGLSEHEAGLNESGLSLFPS
jgi:predicted hydrolase (HD superfamily)